MSTAGRAKGEGRELYIVYYFCANLVSAVNHTVLVEKLHRWSGGDTRAVRCAVEGPCHKEGDTLVLVALSLVMESKAEIELHNHQR